MQNILKSIPELYYEFIAMFIPGFITLELLFLSPILHNVKITQNILTLTNFEKTASFILAGYVFGQALTLISDLLIRKPYNYFFGNPAKNKLNRSNPLLKQIPGPYSNEFISELFKKVESILTYAIQDPNNHSIFDICEQYIKKTNIEAGMLCQKRHASVVMCRNITVTCLITLPFYWETGLWGIISILVLTIIFFLRWSYLRIRRVEFLYHNFFIIAKQQSEESKNGLS